jgi:hypothetical protein
VKDLALLFAGRFRKSLSEQSQVLVMKEFFHESVPKTGASTPNSQSPNDAEDSAVIEDSMGQDDCFVGLVSDYARAKHRFVPGSIVAITSGPSVVAQ